MNVVDPGSPDLVLRELESAADLEQAWVLGRLAFGGEPGGAPPASTPGRRSIGLFDGGRLLAKANVLSYHQWFGGRRVPMGGVSGVAVQPDVRGTGVARRLLAGLPPLMAGQGQVVSALFPTAIGLYRRLGWEVTGSLDETRLRPGELRDVPAAAGVALRPATRDDLPALWQLWQAHAAAGNGLLSRDGPRFPHGVEDLFDADVVTVAVPAADGQRTAPPAAVPLGRPGGDPPGGDPDAAVLLGYVAYDRGLGYGPGAALRVRELLAGTGPAAAALVRALASWDSVVDEVVWPGPVDQLALLLGRPVPPVARARPWMLRLVDVAGAVAARGYDPAVTVEQDLLLVGPGADGSCWHLHVDGGSGSLTPAGGQGRADLATPELHTRGLALLYAGAADTGLLRRTGLLDAAVPGLDAAFTGPAPQLLDYF